MAKRTSSHRRERLCDAAIVLAAMSAAFVLRTWPPADLVFTADGVVFQEADPYYHVRRIENLVHHFPHVIRHDPYALAPHGQDVAVAPLLDWMAAGVAIIVGRGCPSQTVVHLVCAWLPPALGILIVPCVYGIARGLGGRWAAALAAFIAATLPGPYLSRSLLGYTDHHVAEILFSTLTMLAFLWALRRTAPVLDAANPPPDATPRRSSIAWRAAIAGVCLAAYLLSWVGGSLLVFVIFLAVAFQLVSDHLRARGTAIALLAAALPCFLIALVIVAPVYRLPGFDLHVAALIGGATSLCAIAGASIALRARRARAGWIIPAIVAMLAVAAGAALLLAPSTADRVISMLRAFGAGRAARTVTEAAPFPAGTPSELLTNLWSYFSTNALLAIAALVGLWIAVLRRGRADHTLVAVWSTLVFLAMLKQRRFSYYAAVNVAILSAVAVVWFAKWIGRRRRDPRHRRGARKPVLVVAAIAATIAPNVPLALRTARDYTGPSRDWRAALNWLRTNSPEPFDDADYYVARYGIATDRPLRSSVMCWWDHGYWIIQRARRVPVANPTQAGADVAARFFTATDESTAVAIMQKVRATSVVMDRTLPLWAAGGGRRAVGKFVYIPFWANKELSTFAETMLLRTGTGRLSPVAVYHPAYYQTMCARLYVFGAKAFTPDNSTWLVALRDSPDPRGRRIIRERRRFPTYEAATAFAADHPDESWQMVGFTPYRSCVPLEKLRHFRRVYQSPTVAATRGNREIGEVEIFELAIAVP